MNPCLNSNSKEGGFSSISLNSSNGLCWDENDLESSSERSESQHPHPREEAVPSPALLSKEEAKIRLRHLKG